MKAWTATHASSERDNVFQAQLPHVSRFSHDTGVSAAEQQPTKSGHATHEAQAHGELGTAQHVAADTHRLPDSCRDTLPTADLHVMHHAAQSFLAQHHAERVSSSPPAITASPDKEVWCAAQPDNRMSGAVAGASWAARRRRQRSGSPHAPASLAAARHAERAASFSPGGPRSYAAAHQEGRMASPQHPPSLAARKHASSKTEAPQPRSMLAARRLQRQALAGHDVAAHDGRHVHASTSTAAIDRTSSTGPPTPPAAAQAVDPGMWAEQHPGVNGRDGGRDGQLEAGGSHAQPLPEDPPQSAAAPTEVVRAAAGADRETATSLAPEPEAPRRSSTERPPHQESGPGAAPEEARRSPHDSSARQPQPISDEASMHTTVTLPLHGADGVGPELNSSPTPEPPPSGLVTAIRLLNASGPAIQRVSQPPPVPPQPTVHPVAMLPAMAALQPTGPLSPLHISAQAIVSGTARLPSAAQPHPPLSMATARLPGGKRLVPEPCPWPARPVNSSVVTYTHDLTRSLQPAVAETAANVSVLDQMQAVVDTTAGSAKQSSAQGSGAAIALPLSPPDHPRILRFGQGNNTHSLHAIMQLHAQPRPAVEQQVECAALGGGHEHTGLANDDASSLPSELTDDGVGLLRDPRLALCILDQNQPLAMGASYAPVGGLGIKLLSRGVAAPGPYTRILRARPEQTDDGGWASAAQQTARSVMRPGELASPGTAVQLVRTAPVQPEDHRLQDSVRLVRLHDGRPARPAVSTQGNLMLSRTLGTLSRTSHLLDGLLERTRPQGHTTIMRRALSVNPGYGTAGGIVRERDEPEAGPRVATFLTSATSVPPDLSHLPLTMLREGATAGGSSLPPLWPPATLTAQRQAAHTQAGLGLHLGRDDPDTWAPLQETTPSHLWEEKEQQTKTTATRSLLPAHEDPGAYAQLASAHPTVMLDYVAPAAVLSERVPAAPSAGQLLQRSGHETAGHASHGYTSHLTPAGWPGQDPQPAPAPVPWHHPQHPHPGPQLGFLDPASGKSHVQVEGPRRMASYAFSSAAGDGSGSSWQGGESGGAQGSGGVEATPPSQSRDAGLNVAFAVGVPDEGAVTKVSAASDPRVGRAAPGQPQMPPDVDIVVVVPLHPQPDDPQSPAESSVAACMGSMPQAVAMPLEIKAAPVVVEAGVQTDAVPETAPGDDVSEALVQQMERLADNSLLSAMQEVESVPVLPVVDASPEPPADGTHAAAPAVLPAMTTHTAPSPALAMADILRSDVIERRARETVLAWRKARTAAAAASNAPPKPKPATANGTDDAGDSEAEQPSAAELDGSGLTSSVAATGPRPRPEIAAAAQADVQQRLMVALLEAMTGKDGAASTRSSLVDILVQTDTPTLASPANRSPRSAETASNTAKQPPAPLAPSVRPATEVKDTAVQVPGPDPAPASDQRPTYTAATGDGEGGGDGGAIATSTGAALLAPPGHSEAGLPQQPSSDQALAQELLQLILEAFAEEAAARNADDASKGTSGPLPDPANKPQASHDNVPVPRWAHETSTPASLPSAFLHEPARSASGPQGQVPFTALQHAMSHARSARQAGLPGWPAGSTAPSPAFLTVQDIAPSGGAAAATLVMGPSVGSTLPNPTAPRGRGAKTFLEIVDVLPAALPPSPPLLVLQPSQAAPWPSAQPLAAGNVTATHFSDPQTRQPPSDVNARAAVAMAVQRVEGGAQAAVKGRAERLREKQLDPWAAELRDLRRAVDQAERSRAATTIAAGRTAAAQRSLRDTELRALLAAVSDADSAAREAEAEAAATGVLMQELEMRAELGAAREYNTLMLEARALAHQVDELLLHDNEEDTATAPSAAEVVW